MKRPQSKRKRLGALLAVLAGSTLGVGVLASVAVVAPQAGADPTIGAPPPPPPPPPNGNKPPSGSAFLEICKDFVPPSIPENMTPTFAFSVTPVGTGTNDPTVTITAGSNGYACGQPFSVSPGTYKISEYSNSWSSLAAIQQPDGENFIVPNSTSLTPAGNSAGSVEVTVSSGDSATVGFVNDPVYGNLEVCKYAGPNDPAITGTYTFNLSGENGYTGTATAQLPGCSQPVSVPAGTVTVTEAGTNLYVTGITAVYDGSTSNALVGTANLQTGTATVNVRPTNTNSGTGTQTDVTYNDDVVQFKVCKAWGGGGAQPSGVSAYPFTLSASGPAGPTTVPPTLQIPAGTPSNPQCSSFISLRAGTLVTVTEGITPGTKLASITTSGALSVPNPTSTGDTVNPDALNRTVQVVVGEPVTGSATNPINEGWVTFTNVAASADPMKICVTPGTPAPSVGSYKFTVSGNPGVTTTVTTNNCSFVEDAHGNYVYFPFASTQTVTGTNVSPDVTTGITVDPTMITELLNGSQVTNIPSISGTPDLSKPSVSVVMSEGGTNVTEVYFTIGGHTSSGSGSKPSTASTGSGTGSASDATTGNNASSSSTSTSTSTSTGGAVGGGGGGGAVGGGGNPVSTPPANNNALPQVTVSPASSPNTTSTGNTSTSSTASAALLAKDQARLVQLRKDIVITRTSLAKYHKLWLTAAHNHWKIRTTLIKVVQHLQARLKALLNLQKSLILAIHKL